MPVVKGRWIADMKIDRVADNEEPAEERARDFRPVSYTHLTLPTN